MKYAWAVIINPKAGSGRGKKDWPIISDLIRERGIKFVAFFTERKYHAIDLTRDAIKKGYVNFIAVGGDGTIHEVLNGIFSQNSVSVSELTLGVIPVGTGNDWIKMYNIPQDYRESIKVLATASTTLQDIAAVTVQSNGQPVTRYMINIGGMGFDANVCYHFDRMKLAGQNGKTVYMRGLLRAFFGYSNRNVRIIADGRLCFEGPMFSLAMGIGRYSGGGMLQVPDSLPDDGLINVTVVKKMPRMKVLMNIKSLFDGSIYSVSGVEHFVAQKLEVESTPASRVEIDGENVGLSAMKVEVIPLAIRVVVG